MSYAHVSLPLLKKICVHRSDVTVETFQHENVLHSLNDCCIEKEEGRTKKNP